MPSVTYIHAETLRSGRLCLDVLIVHENVDKRNAPRTGGAPVLLTWNDDVYNFRTKRQTFDDVRVFVRLWRGSKNKGNRVSGISITYRVYKYRNYTGAYTTCRTFDVYICPWTNAAGIMAVGECGCGEGKESSIADMTRGPCMRVEMRRRRKKSPVSFSPTESAAHVTSRFYTGNFFTARAAAGLVQFLVLRQP